MRLRIKLINVENTEDWYDFRIENHKIFIFESTWVEINANTFKVVENKRRVIKEVMKSTRENKNVV